MGDWQIIGDYCCMDVDLTLKLFEYFEQELEFNNLVDLFYLDEVMPLYREVTIPMKDKGISLDTNYLQEVKQELECDIMRLQEEAFANIQHDIKPLVEEILDEKVKESRKGKFAEKLLEHYGIEVPRTKSGRSSFAKKNVQHLSQLYPDNEAINWLMDESVELPRDLIYEVKKSVFVEKNPELPHVFNLNSKPHLAWLIFDRYGLKPHKISRKTGKPSVDKDTLEVYKDENPAIPKLMELFKQEKILGTYINNLLNNADERGWVYPSFLQHGTTSGRYSSGGGAINFQTLPRDDSRVKRGFKAPEGYVFVNADFSSLEPRVFAWVSNDPGLKAVYEKGLDLYSQIAIDVFGLEDVSADPNADNFLKKVAPEWRNKAKVFTLAVVYGAGAGRIASLMGISFFEAQKIIDKYLDAYPRLRDYMEDQREKAIHDGEVRTSFGRVRNLKEVKYMWNKYGRQLDNKQLMMVKMGGARAEMYYEDYLYYRKSKYNADKSKARKAYAKFKELGEEGSRTYYKFRKLVNNSRNFPIQGTAAHIANASAIKLAREIKNNNLDAWIYLHYT
jgi:DNA polymerase I-like protein with 3'-5' exonuclease and polymerase domains